MTSPQREHGSCAPAADAASAQPYRVMVVDDSVVVRSMITRLLESDPEIKVVASFANGQQAVDSVARLKPDLVVLDIEMPVMDGLTALPKLIAAVPSLKVIMASTLTRRNAEISLQAMDLGAADYVAKPEARADISGDDFKAELLRKAKVLSSLSRAGGAAAAPVPVKARTPEERAAATVVPRPDQPISLREPSAVRPEILAIGSSTGGPKALTDMLATLHSSFTLPIVIAQHMPETFTAMLAERIARVTDRPCREGQHGEALKNGHIYVAPGDYHMTLARDNGAVVIRLDQGPRENFCRPAVDRLFVSVADLYGSKTLAVVLTGMGSDGLKSCEKIITAKGTVVTQNAETSVVWGMPGVVATAGFSCANLPLMEIGPYVSKMAAGGAL